MRIVALEEHVSFPAFAAELDGSRAGQGGGSGGSGAVRDELADVDRLRLQSMDENGITLQVLSIPGPGAAMMADPDAGWDYARRYNNALAEQARKHPDRFLTFAHLPLLTPDAAADELTRAVQELGCPGAMVSGMTRGKFLDDPAFAPVLSRAEQLDVPIYIHPGVPPPAIRDAYYGGFAPDVSFMFATAAWGWHIETGVHVIRMVLAGTFDKHPKLKIIVGHMGEALPFMLDRLDTWLTPRAKNLERGVAQTILDHVHITTAGFFTLAPFMSALMTFGADRILFSVDYPFSKNAEARAFLDALPVTPSDKEKIAHGNADRILKLAEFSSRRS